MTSTAPSSMASRVRLRGPSGAARRRGPAATLAALAAAAALSAACAGADSAAPEADSGGRVAAVSPQQAGPPSAPVPESRTTEGIRAAGGVLSAGAPCPALGSAGAAEAHKFAIIAPNVDLLGEVGLGDLVFDPIERIFEAYIANVNSFGGINGNCFDFVLLEYGFSTIEEDLGAICAEVPVLAPLAIFAFAPLDVLIGCTTLAGQIPTIALYAQFPEDMFAQTGGLLKVDHGSLEFLLENGVRAAVATGRIDETDAVALLYDEVPAADSLQATFARTAEDLGLRTGAAVVVPEGLFGTTAALVEGLLVEAGGDLFDADEGAFAAAAAALGPEFGGLMAASRQYYLETAAAMRDAGVNTVVASASWNAVRNLMRAAEMVEWSPRWITNDSQFALIVLLGAPEAQAENYLQISSRRAADDPIDGLDRGCLSLRNTDSSAPPFDHRFHTDAWSLLTAACDYLDVVFSALSRVDGPVDRESFSAALDETDYVTAHGQRLRFTVDDPYGSDSFRVLGADPACVLNVWGCMRPLSGWMETSTSLAGGGDQ